MASKEREFGLIVKQPEDEIAGVNMAIGAAHVGARSMVATSGGGFSLMVEAVGMAGMSETPLVVVLGQRAGPSTGLPTRTEQGDLKFAINASQGEFPKAVIAPGDVEECFYFAGEAFNVAEKFQAPVILLTDKFLAESFESVGKFDQNKIKIDRGLLLDEAKLPKEGGYERYALTETGVSPRALPGMKNGIFRAQSYEHNEEGHFDESAETRVQMAEKRMRKMKSMLDFFPKPKLAGEKNSEITFVSWGSPKGAVLDAIDLLSEKGVKADFLQLSFLWPFPAKEVKEILLKCKNPVLVENNRTAQLGALIAEQTGVIIEKRILKFNARPFTAKFILQELEKTKG
jgi:2-oxoglutarate ferredoxin oxidoreductase subunit alpha